MAGLFDDVPDAKKSPASGLFDDIPSNSAPQGSWTDNIRDPVAGILKIGPTALKGVADIARLLTGDRVGVDTSDAMKRGMESIDDIVGSERLRTQKAAVNEALQNPNVSIGQLPGVVMDNPRAALDATVSTVGSMFLPAGAAAGTVKALPSVARVLPGAAAITPGAAATGATVVTGAAQNAAETFADTEGRDLSDRYIGAGISGATSLVLGRLLGGGAEGVVARRLAGEAGARGALALGRSAVTTGAKEFGQEFGEESANYVGKQVAKDEAIDPNTMGKQGLYGGMIGFGMGGASDVATNVGNIGRAGIERQVADAIDKAAQEYADQNAPRVVQQTVARIFDDLPQQAKPQTTPEAAPEIAPEPLALPFDPNVRNLQATMVADAAGNVRPMDADEQLTQQQQAERMAAMGLTPDVQRAINQRQQSPEPQPAAVPSDLIQRLLGAGWTPPAVTPETGNAALIEQAQPEQAQAAADRREMPQAADVPLMNDGKTPQRLGVGNVPMADGAKPFKTKLAAQKAKKLQPTMRVVKVEGGYALADKTPAQLAAAEKAAKRLRTFSTGTAGKPMAAHEFIVGKGGLSAAARSELGIEGNPRVGNRTLYGRQGLTLAQAAELLREAGYITDETENSASDIIRRSMSDPQYTPEGWEQVAEQEREAQFEDYLAAQQEAAQADDFDPFDPLSDAGFMEDDSDGTGFWEADPALQAEVSALAAQLEVLGVDTYDVLDPIIRANTQATQDQYNELAKQALTEAIAQATQPAGNRDSGQNDGEQGQARGQTEAQPDEGLTAYTPQEIEDRLAKLEQAERERQQQEREAEQRQQADAERDTFTLTGSDRAADVAAAQGQTDIFSAAAEPAYNYTRASKIDSPAQGVLAGAKERKNRAFARLKAVRQQVKDGTANRLELLKAESAHKDAVRDVEAAEAQLERDANRLGLTTVREEGRDYTNDGMPANEKAPTSDKSDAFAGLPQGGMQERAVRAVSGSPEPAQSGFEVGSENHLSTLRLVDVFGNGSRIEYYDDAKGMMYSSQRYPTGLRWTAWDVLPKSEGGNQVVGEMDRHRSFSDAVSAVRGARISAAAKARNAKYGAIPRTWNGDAKKLGKALIDAGVGIDRFASSTQSKSKYVYLDSGKKIRLSDHSLPSAYDAPDYDFRYGGDIKSLVQEVVNDQSAPDADGAAFEKLAKTIQTRETNKGAAMFEPVTAYNAEAPRRPYTDDRQLQLFLDNGPVESQAGPRGEAAQRAAVAAVDDLRSTETILGLALSRDYAARQRVSLVGQKVSSAEDLAVLAQVYRDPRFETFRVVFVNDSGKVVSQVGLTSRLPAAAPGIMGSDLDAYLGPLMATARNRGASGYYMLHNHPSGSAKTSRADEVLTNAYADRTFGTDMQFRGHVVIDTNEYSVINGRGESALFKKDFGQPAPYQAQEWADVKIGGPADVMAMAKRLQVDEDAVTLIHTDHQYRVKAISTIPAAVTEGPYAELKRQVARSSLKNQGSQLFAVSRSRRALITLGDMVRDGIHVDSDGAVRAMSAEGAGGGQPFPNNRRARVSPDTSPEFAYLRQGAQPAPMQRVAEPSMDQTQTPEFKRWFGDSKVVDAEGKPLVVYHGTQADFDAFDKSKSGANWRQGEGAFFFTNRQRTASNYATRGGEGANVMPVYLSITNPYTQAALDPIDAYDNWIKPEREALEAQGYDGVIVKSADGGGDLYVAFFPEQIKSATGNRGTFDPNDHSIVREDAPAYDPRSLQGSTETWTVPEPGTFDNAVRAIQNNKIDLKRVRDSIQQRYGRLSEQADAYLNEELYHGKVAARIESLHKEHVEPILAKIAVAGKNAGVTINDVNLYLHARHAPERNAAMKAINPDMENNEALSGMSNQQAAKVMADFTAAGKDKALALIARDVDQLLADTRTNLVADGLEDAGVIAAWEAAYKHYVPLQRDIGSSGTPKGMGFSVRGPEAKRAVGSNKEVVNILANIVTQAETAAIRAEKAVVGRSLLAMARQYPNPDFWKVDIAPTKPRIDKETGLVQRNAVDPLFQTADNVIMVKDYGQEHFIVFSKDSERAMAMAHAMKNLDIAPMNKILEVANKGTRFLASLLTQRNPLFWLTNFARDIQGAMLNLEGTEAEGLQRQVLGNLSNAFKGMHALVRGEGRGQWARYAQELKNAGGTTGYMQAFENSDARMADITKEVERMQQGKADPRRIARLTLEFIDDYNDIIENAVRLSVFQAAREGGASTAKASSIAKNITVNFNRKGNLTPPINALYMFFNASVQGTARLAQAVATSKTARAAVGGIAIMGFLLDALNRAMSDDDEETGHNRYDLIPEFDKSKNWIIMNPMRPGEYVKVPLPLGPHVFHNAGRLLSDAIFRDDPRNAAEYGWSLAGTFIDAFSPLGTAQSVGQLIAPSVLDPVLQVTENKSFTGAPVYKSADRGFGNTDPKPAYTRYFESTPDVWKGASRMLNDMTGGDKDKPGAINVEPDILKHVFYTLTGGPGRTLDQAIDATQAGARGKELTVNRVPLASRFYGANDDQQRERAYYDDRKRVQDAKTAFDYYIKLGRQDEARKIAEELGDGDAVKGRKLMLDFARAEKSVRKINAEIRRELERESDDEAKAEQLRALRQRRVQVMSDAVNDDE